MPRIDDDTILTVQYPDRQPHEPVSAPWHEFETVNRDDPDMLAAVKAQLRAGHRAEIGGGGFMRVWLSV